MDKKLSIKISIISFLLLLHVVVGHSVNVFYDKTGDNTVWFIENLFSTRLVKIIIPIFFFISSYLFFLNFDSPQKINLKKFKEKIIKRLGTLGKPYFFWCTFWFLFMIILQIIPKTSIFFTTKLYQLSLWKQFWNLYLEPIEYPFWFIRELLLYIIISPLLYFLVKQLKFYIIILLFIFSIFKYSLFNVFEIDIYRIHMLVYYCLGIFCAINKTDLSIRLNLFFQIVLIIIGFSLCILLIYFDINNQNNQLWYIVLISNITTIVGVISVWSLYDYLDNKFDFKYKEIYSYGFIIYATHGIPILLLKEATVAILHPSKWQLLGLYIFNFTITIITCLYFGKMLKKKLPRFYQFVTGNR
jgi:Acyltransferase family